MHGHIVEGLLRLSSQAGTFYCHAQAGNEADVLMQLQSGVRKKIKKWRALRFRTGNKALLTEDGNYDIAR